MFSEIPRREFGAHPVRLARLSGIVHVGPGLLVCSFLPGITHIDLGAPVCSGFPSFLGKLYLISVSRSMYSTVSSLLKASVIAFTRPKHRKTIHKTRLGLPFVFVGSYD